MNIEMYELKHDTYYFFRQQIKLIVFISIIATLSSILIDILIRPNMYILSIIEHRKFKDSISLLDFINSMSIEEKKELFKYSLLKMTEFLISKTLLLGGIMTLIKTLSNNYKRPIITYMYSLFSCLPNLLILNFITALIIQISFIFLIIPGIFLSVLLSLSPIIFYFNKHSIAKSMYLSIIISFKNIKIIGLGILYWMFGKFVLTIIFSHTYFLNKNFSFLISSISMNILYAILAIYLFRFYVLFTNAPK
ncbi:UPF0259 family protein [Buchnera aphidicola (Muscaphis stroyani)]|uniref:UPF0259 membrane protein D9V75_01335 n=1 Tax=Buchnera aphidicola (Muscaphis stroyani) TaxID=1241869 RepID=A0A4D6YCT3_9GAMM|nr:YciC family protein [Buchnera aphidicola]QCI24351.1 UPF0259 family protein [Buchnera aphidicola (Muscaphis stroyani)]